MCLGYVRIVTRLIKAGAMVNLSNTMLQTPLHKSAIIGKTFCIFGVEKNKIFEFL